MNKKNNKPKEKEISFWLVKLPADLVERIEERRILCELNKKKMMARILKDYLGLP